MFCRKHQLAALLLCSALIPTLLRAQAMVMTLEYPKQSRRAGHEGSVRFRVDITPKGKAENCMILDSSGYPDLDEATCGEVVDNLRFTPAADERGHRVKGSYTNWVHWKIEALTTCRPFCSLAMDPPTADELAAVKTPTEEEGNAILRGEPMAELNRSAQAGGIDTEQPSVKGAGH